MADPSTLASDLRQGVDDLSTLASADLALLWEQVDDPLLARDALLDVLPDLIATYGAAAATLAADWYDDLRAESTAPGRFTAVPVEVGAAGAVSLAKWGIGPAFGPEPDWRRAQVLVEGGLQRRIANAARYTVTKSAVLDPGAFGWQRVGDGKSCPFCLMLIARGAVYQESSAQFASHDHCGCQAMPAFQGSPVPVKAYVPSPRESTEADRARVRDWIATSL